MDFRTYIELGKPTFKISHKSNILMLGSCFSQNIGYKLIQAKLNARLNPFGVLYNPESINQAIGMLIKQKNLTINDIFEHKGIYHSFYHHSSFSHIEQSKCLKNINRELSIASDFLYNTDILIITFGTSYVYQLKESSQIVGNCHKLPANKFNRFRLSSESIVESWAALLTKLYELRPELKIIFTISPIRHMNDGAHDNQLSKAILLLAVNELCKSHQNTFYFPSYEIVLDELRDYRFYAEDMIHPNSIAINYIYEKFSDTFFDKHTLGIIKEWDNIKTALGHRPFNDKSAEHKHFLRQTLLKLEAFSEKYPYICCTNEISDLESKLGV